MNCGNIEIQSGTVTATGNEYGAGIGGGQNANCGNITISGGIVTATGGYRAAGIGGGRRGVSGTMGGYDSGSCGNINISGGTVTATGGQNAAGIGGGRGNNNNYKSSCGTITITTGVTQVTATKGSGADNSIGAGNVGTCGTVTIGGIETGNITTSPYTYPAPAGIVDPVVGQVIGADGKNYADAAAATAAGTTAVAKICYVGSETGEAAPYNHGLALALSDANGGTSCKWKTSNTDAGHTKQSSSSFTSESGLQYNATHNSDTYSAFKYAIANNGTAAPTGCSSWFLASGYQWQKMAGAVGGYNNLGLTEGAAYWSSSELDASKAWVFLSGNWYQINKNTGFRVRACLAF